MHDTLLAAYFSAVNAPPLPLFRGMTEIRGPLMARKHERCEPRTAPLVMVTACCGTSRMVNS